jgi:hypothetical protein
VEQRAGWRRARPVRGAARPAGAGGAVVSGGWRDGWNINHDVQLLVSCAAGKANVRVSSGPSDSES